MESSSAWFYFIVGDFDFAPAESSKIEEPQIIHICNSFTSINDKVGEKEFGYVVGSFPWSYLILFGSDFDPFFSGPVQNADRIEALFIGTSAAEDDNLVIFLIVVH